MFYRKHKRVTLDCGDVLVTKQAHKDECDINRILRQYQRTGIITHVQSARPSYTDLPSDVDFQASMHVLMQAEEAFSNLPARVRAHFDNDPGRFLAAFSDEKQADQLREFGLLKPLSPSPTLSSDPAAPPSDAAPPASKT